MIRPEPTRQAADIINGNFMQDLKLLSSVIVVIWRWVVYLLFTAFNFTLDAAAAANYRLDALQNSSGTYIIFFKGTEVLLLRYRQRFSVGTVLLGCVSLFGTT
jgi:hypothetical protein